MVILLNISWALFVRVLHSLTNSWTVGEGGQVVHGRVRTQGLSLHGRTDAEASIGGREITRPPGYE
jgi:hypothetical protein